MRGHDDDLAVRIIPLIEGDSFGTKFFEGNRLVRFVCFFDGLGGLLVDGGGKIDANEFESAFEAGDSDIQLVDLTVEAVDVEVLGGIGEG